MHMAALRELGLSDWSYEAIEVSPPEFKDRVREMKSAGFIGANVTVPHKVAALELADEASQAAWAIGAANTLSFIGDGIAAENTDAVGFLEALPVAPAEKRALVLGAGGSARAVVWALVTAGGNVHVWNRTPERAERLVADLGGSAVRLDNMPGRRQHEVGSFDLLVNATTIGMGVQPPARPEGWALKALHLDADSFAQTQIVVDLAYGPADTDIARIGRSCGADVIDGIEVLVRQGAASLRVWTGLEPPVETMRRAARDEWRPTSDPNT
jgi:shikimate dehydrogenase